MHGSSTVLDSLFLVVFRLSCFKTHVASRVKRADHTTMKAWGPYFCSRTQATNRAQVEGFDWHRAPLKLRHSTIKKKVELDRCASYRFNNNSKYWLATLLSSSRASDFPEHRHGSFKTPKEWMDLSRTLSMRPPPPPHTHTHTHTHTNTSLSLSLSLSLSIFFSFSLSLSHAHTLSPIAVCYGLFSLRSVFVCPAKNAKCDDGPRVFCTICKHPSQALIDRDRPMGRHVSPSREP